MAAWLAHADATHRIIRDKYRHLDGPALLTATVEENVLVQLENLRTHPTVAAKLASGFVRLHGWVYKIETGEVFAYDPASGQFALLSEIVLIGAPAVSRRSTDPAI
jgi:carbonic anhydrase